MQQVCAAAALLFFGNGPPNAPGIRRSERGSPTNRFGAAQQPVSRITNL